MEFCTTASIFIHTVALLTTCATTQSETSQLSVPLTVSDSIGVTRKSEAVCSGIPFSEGILQSEDQLYVESEEGTPLVTQTKVLGQWPDGSVRWLLVQFIADCPANDEQKYYLKCGENLSSESSLAVADESKQVTIDTGAMKVAIPKTELAILGKVQGIKYPSKFQFLMEDGTIHDNLNSTPESVTIEEAGPIRATIHIIGWLQDNEGNKLYKLDTRLRFYAGQSIVRADYTFICLGQPELHHVKEISVKLSPAAVDSAKFALPSITGTINSEQTAVLSADTDMVCRVGIDGELQKAKDHLDGWGQLKCDDAAIGVAVRDFWHLCPKAIEISSNSIKIDLWSNRSGDILNLGRTRAKTHYILYDFGTEQDTDRIKAFQEPLIATADPEYFCSTDALNPLSPFGAPETAEFDQKVGAGFDNLHNQRETMPRENGMLHYGDYYHGGYGNKLTRGDLEYDTGHACFLLYARSSQRKHYDFAVACNQHFIDIDVDQEKGDPRYHGYYERAETHEAVTTGMEWGHIFVDCAADAYYLTGDERSLEAVRMIADRTSSIADGEGYDRIRDIFAGAERQLGWPLQALCRAYEVTGEEKFLKASEKIINYIKLYAKNPEAAYKNGKWWRSWMMDGCKVFMTGQLHDGLAAYYKITHDGELRDAIVTSLDWLIDNMWNPDMDGFVYEFNAMNRPHRREGMTGLNMLVVDAFRFGYEMTGDRRYLAVAMRSFWGQARDMSSAPDGKQFSQDTRTSPHTAAYFYREHITPDNLPEPPYPIRQKPSDPVSEPSAEILLQANFDGDLSYKTPNGTETGQSMGKIGFVAGRNGQAVAVSNDGYVSLKAPVDMLRHPGSIELWVRLHFKKNPQSPGQRAIFHIEGKTPLIDSLSACTIYDELRIRMKDNVGHMHGSAEGSIEYWEANEWHHVVVTWDADRVRLYLDGKEQMRENEGEYAGDSVIDLPAGQQTKINFGWRFGNWHCDCDIDELIVHSKPLTAAEVANKYSMNVD